jgi:hypothetical protein
MCAPLLQRENLAFQELLFNDKKWRLKEDHHHSGCDITENDMCREAIHDEMSLVIQRQSLIEYTNENYRGMYKITGVVQTSHWSPDWP